jgi:acetyl-CoA carboxylase biotin carboxyl carrier protein
MTDGPDLTPEDVEEILRLIDASPYEEFELETPRFSLRVGRDEGSAQLAARPAPSPDGLVDVTSPMVGVFHRAPAPGADPFVEQGSRVEPETQVCIIEVMKLMSSVAAGTRGIVAEVCVENGSAVEYGDVLFRIQADG